MAEVGSFLSLINLMHTRDLLQFTFKQVECKRVGKIFYTNNNKKNVRMTMLILEKNRLNKKLFPETKDTIC